jgi:hypothetical protein
MKFNVKAFAIAHGLVWGLILMFMSWSSCNGWQSEMVNVMKSSYVGMDSTFIGGVIAFAWGIVSGIVTGGTFSYVYNRLVGKK